MPSRNNGHSEEPDRVMNQLNSKLKAHHLRQAKAMLYTYLADRKIDPEKYKVNSNSINSLIGHLEEEYLAWQGLPNPIEPVYNCEAI